MTYYDILGVSVTATKTEIKQAYLKLAKEFHPDKSAGVSPAVRKLVEEKFKDIQEAFEILSKHRSEYDNQLLNMAPPPPPRPPSPPPKQPSPSAAPSTTPTQPYVAPKPPKAAPKWVGWAIGAAILSMSWWGARSDTKKPAATVQTESIPRTQTPAPSADAQGFCGTAGYPDCTPNVVGGGEPGIGKEKATASESSRKLIEKFGGIVHNQSANRSAEFGIVVEDAGGSLSGCMGVKQPLFGSGPFAGRANGADVSFVVTSEIGTITFVGRRNADKIDGAYKVQRGSGPDESGTFALAKIKSGLPADGLDVQRCPSDAEVHKIKTPNSDLTSYLIPSPQKADHKPSAYVIPSKGQVDVYYADDWTLVDSFCKLPTGITPQIEMRCGAVPGRHPDWAHTPHFTTRLLLDAADVEKFNSKTEPTISLLCADALEANGDLVCSSHWSSQLSSQLKDVTQARPGKWVPKPIPKYVALGPVSCYANRRVMLYTDEALGKSARQLNPGESIFKVGAMGDSVGLTFSTFYNETPEFWIDGNELEKLTCTK